MCVGPATKKGDVAAAAARDVFVPNDGGIHKDDEGVYDFYRSYTDEPHKSR